MNDLIIINKVNELLSKMTLKEKIGQLYQAPYEGMMITGPLFGTGKTNDLLKAGLVGSIIGLADNHLIYHLQKIAVEETRLGIPLIFANDIIHGCRTILPINLAMSCSWNLELIKEAIQMSAKEASHSGVQLTFSPMVDLVRDPRWGRVMESAGEDVYLGSKIAGVYVDAYQGDDLTSEDSVASCVKHFAGYGACVGGRDYQSADMSLDTFYQYYLPPFTSAIKHHAQMVMSSFNTFNGVPATCNKFLLKDTLRKKLHFDGAVISDYTSSLELINHKVCDNELDVARKCIQAGLDMEMVSTCYIDHLEELIKIDSNILNDINEACKNILTLKYRMGLFDNPYKNINLHPEDYWLKDEFKRIALKMAHESICLLENDGTLPLNKCEKIAFIGPFVTYKQVQGNWGGKVNEEDNITLCQALDNYKYPVITNQIMNFNEPFDKKIVDDLVNGVEKIVIAVGEAHGMSGESQSRTSLNLPKYQEELIDYCVSKKKKIVLLIHAGRPLILTKYYNLVKEGKISSIVYAWFLGTMSGNAIVDTLYGDNNPSGKITMSFPYSIGQIPIYYNMLPTGRPIKENEPLEYHSRYIDCPNEPLYPFGYGLSYSKFEYQNLIIKNPILDNHNYLDIQIEVTNKSNIAGYETIQLYIECLYSEVSRPLKELKGFQKLYFEPHEVKVVKFKLRKRDLKYVTLGVNKVSCGKYRLYVGENARKNKVVEFTVI